MLLRCFESVVQQQMHPLQPACTNLKKGANFRNKECVH
jgi:hypothetical protein